MVILHSDSKWPSPSFCGFWFSELAHINTGLWLVETDPVTSVLASYWSVAAQLCQVIGHCAMCFSAPQSELLVKYLLSTGYGLDGKKTQDFHHHYQAGTDAVNDLFIFFALQIIYLSQIKFTSKGKGNWMTLISPKHQIFLLSLSFLILQWVVSLDRYSSESLLKVTDK